MEKEYQYAAKLQSQIADMFDEDSENYIDKSEFNNEENATAFIHALANLVPCNIYNKLAGNDKNILQFNHIANQLVFQFAQAEKEAEGDGKE